MSDVDTDMQTIKDTDHEEAHAVLMSQDTWQLAIGSAI